MKGYELKYLVTAEVVALTATSVSARDQVHVAGSSTVLPYAAIVAEAFGENFDFPTPIIESGGSGAGRKRLCEGVGSNTIDIANSSSHIKQSDIDRCAENGVTYTSGGQNTNSIVSNLKRQNTQQPDPNADPGDG